MKWDDELKLLTQRVRQTFGPSALAEAYVRAMTAAPAADVSEDWMTVRGDETKFVDGRVSASYLKAELRRMLTAH
jgi:hypothetical protein